MPSKRSQIKYMITIYITAHGRTETEANSFLHLTDRDVYIGQETGNCSVQAKEYDETLLQFVIDWNLESKWLKSGAHLDFTEYEDYKIGPYQFEDETQVTYQAQVAMVGPANKRDKVMDMEGRENEPSRPGIVVLIQEKNNTNPQLNKSTIRKIMRKIYSQGDEELGKDTTNIGHRFSAIFMNNKFIEQNNHTEKNIISRKFNDYVVDQDSLTLSDIIETSKFYASKIIDVKPNNKSILYTIVDTTCNVYATEDIDEAPKADQDEIRMQKSAIKARYLSKLLIDEKTVMPLLKPPTIITVTPDRRANWWYSGTASRLRPRPGDEPSAFTIENEENEENDVVIEDAIVSPVITDEFLGLFKSTRKNSPKKFTKKFTKKYTKKKAPKNTPKKKHQKMHQKNMFNIILSATQINQEYNFQHDPL
jgi:hypothetical protein